VQYQQTLARFGSVLCLLLLISGCTTREDGQIKKQEIGTASGAVIGGLAGSLFGHGAGKVAAVAIGAGLGAWAGNTIGAKMDRDDLMYQQKAYQLALEGNASGAPSGWRNPDSGHYGSITPTKTYSSGDGRYCREFTESAYIGREKATVVGFACRNPDGTWSQVNRG